MFRAYGGMDSGSRQVTNRTNEILVAIAATVIGVFLAVNLIHGVLSGAWNW